jgi:hypothetical protein
LSSCPSTRLRIVTVFRGVTVPRPESERFRSPFLAVAATTGMLRADGASVGFAPFAADSGLNRG